MTRLLNRAGPFVQLSILLGLTVLVYHQALDSRFLLDDYVNFSDLGLVEEFGHGYFIFSGATGNAGRPLSLLTFALQYEAWPDNPAAFKIVNLLIHLANGLLVYLLARFLTSRMSLTKSRAGLYSLFIAGLWLLHPIQTSTVLYAIQRMNMLATFFVLSGILGYLYFRTRYGDGRSNRGLLGMGLSVGMALILGVLSKENAILLPLFILLIEVFIHPSIFKDAKWRCWAWIFLALPLILLAFYFSYKLGHTLESYDKRPFSMGERLLTQAVVLVDYLGKILIPKLGAYGLYNDDFVASRHFFSPPATALAVVFVSAIIAASLYARKSFPLIAFGFLWFFAGHILEASHLPLELYFEHRNYLPLFGLCFVVVGFVEIFSKYLNRRMAGLFAAGYLSLALIITYLEADLWSKPVIQAEIWAKKHPQSHRAVENLANAYMRLEQYDKAKDTYRRIKDFSPNDIYPDIQLMTIDHCLENNIYTDEEWKELYGKAEKAEPEGLASLVGLDTLVTQKRKGRCPDIDIRNLMRLILILAHNPEFISHRPLLHEVATVLAIEYGDPRSALANINEAIRNNPQPNMYILKLKILIALERVEESEETLMTLKDIIKRDPMDYVAFTNQINDLEERINKLKR
ncbi:MAG: hypothetical protein WD750_08380 [Gammaproteobacteria bacterium]